MASTATAAPPLSPAAAVASAAPCASSQRPLGPEFGSRFRPARARDIIASVLKARLSGAAYNADKASALTCELADDIKQRIKGEDWPRYKYAVQVFISEQRGEGCRMASRCFWDNETDAYAFESFNSETLVCVAAVFALYVY